MAEAWRTAPLPPDWPRTRRRILRRDHYRCRRCGQPAREVDHIVPAHLGGTDTDDNLQSLCIPCHRSKTGREAQATQPRRRRTPEPHPGLLTQRDHHPGGRPPPEAPQTRRG